MDRLSKALERHREEIQQALREARNELEGIRARERELTALIEQAEAALNETPPQKLTLHDAIVVVLEDRASEWMTTQEIAREVNRRGLYAKRDGSPVESNQIHARTKNYSHLFDKDQQRIRLRERDQPPSTRAVSGERSKYDALRDFLPSISEDEPLVTFKELDTLVGGLPASAWKHQAWWANDTTGLHVQANAWIGAGYRVAEVNQDDGWVRFRKEPSRFDDGAAGVREPRVSPPQQPAGGIELDERHTDPI